MDTVIDLAQMVLANVLSFFAIERLKKYFNKRTKKRTKKRK